MNDLNLRLPGEDTAMPQVSHPPIGRLLVDLGKIAPRDLQHALNLQQRIDAPLGDIMISEGLIEKRDVLSALATQARTTEADLVRDPPLPAMARTLPASLCLKYGVVPWKQDAQALYVATASPARFAALRAALDPQPLPLFPVIVEEAQIRAQQNRLYGMELAAAAETCVAEAESCRSWQSQGRRRALWAGLAVGGLLLALAFFPLWTLTLLSLWAVAMLVMTSTLKLAALTACLWPRRLRLPAAATRLHEALRARRRAARKGPELMPVAEARASAAVRMVGALRAFPGGGLPGINAGEQRFRLPRVSVLVPLLHEREIAGQLIDRLSRLTYPKSLIEVMLVLEEGDQTTRETLARTDLPDWMSVIEVPRGNGLTTKPRALNYALNFCNGSIIGVWDAEDWPEADQIEKVVSRFHAAPPDVVCLQGILDYYNSRTSWLARCFAVEYAMWWRVFLPGIARLGLVVPLGGTTLFFRRTALEILGGWDAHNVTEDADLGVRLARHGFRTELLQTVTREEATSRIWPWIRQRSRWLKGFLVTYFVHMRDPLRLLRDLGPLRFLGLQTMFLASVSQFAAVPLLWSFWGSVLGFGHPLDSTLGPDAIRSLTWFFLATEVLSLVFGIIAIRRSKHRHLLPVLPTMTLYFGLGALAAYKALWELVRMPFFWDKTQHGVSELTDPPPALRHRGLIAAGDQPSS